MISVSLEGIWNIVKKIWCDYYSTKGLISYQKIFPNNLPNNLALHVFNQKGIIVYLTMGRYPIPYDVPKSPTNFPTQPPPLPPLDPEDDLPTVPNRRIFLPKGRDGVFGKRIKKGRSLGKKGRVNDINTPPKNKKHGKWNISHFCVGNTSSKWSIFPIATC